MDTEMTYLNKPWLKSYKLGYGYRYHAVILFQSCL